MSQRKSFVEVLKENLSSESFKPLKLPKQKSHLNILLDPYKKEIYDYFICLKEVSKVHSSKRFYAKLFRDPVKISFYWCEEDWQGSIFAIYEHDGKFISVNGGFGSCSGCDAFITDSEEIRDHSQERLDKIFSRLIINENINDINIHGNHREYTHPELVSKFNIWIKNKIEIKPEIKSEIKHEVKPEIKPEIKLSNKIVKSWADIVSKKK